MALKVDDYKDFEMFYELPKELFNNRFKGLSIGAKVLYAILSNKWKQSQEANLHDENGIYCVVSVDMLSKIMGCSERTISSYKKELRNYNLISEQRRFDSINKIYVKKYKDKKFYKEVKGENK